MSAFRRVAPLLLTSLMWPSASAAQTSVFINELHYDNASTDQNEAVEVVGPAGTNLTGWSVVLYNGNGGAAYATLPLSGTLTNDCEGFGAAFVPAPGIQNGAPDGLALVDELGAVIQFLSYEGTFQATSGPANGMTSVDIGVAEDGTGSATASLQLTGTGAFYEDFTWVSAPLASMGECNVGQMFVGGVDSPPVVLSTAPSDGASGVSPTVELLVRFLEDVTVSQSWYTLECSESGSVGSTSSSGPRNFEIELHQELVASEVCLLTILADQVTDVDGTPDQMDADVLVGFTVAPDLAPFVVQTTPADGVSSVSVSANVVVTFSEPVSVTNEAFNLSCSQSGVHQFSQSGGPSVYVLDPVAEFDFLETCTLSIIAAHVADLDGVPHWMGDDVIVVFGTEQSLADYYATVDASSASTLRASLHAIIKDHIRFPYTSASTDTWDILDLVDEDPMDPARVVDVYKNESYPKAGAGNANYNREHRWAKSYGFPNDTANSWAYTDVHHLIVANAGYNSARNNRYFDYCADSCTEYPTQATNGSGGGTGSYPGNSNWGKGDRWEVWDFRRGDVARALLYMDVRYAGGINAFGAAEPNLVLTDDPSLIQTTGSNTTGIAYLGLRSVLIEWHELDPPDEHERLRNALVQTFQENRNPFVDHPQWVACVFEGDCPAPNQAPVFDDLEITVPENLSFGVVVVTLLAVDPDEGQSLSYSIESGNEAGPFALNGISGDLSVLNPSLFDFEATAGFVLTVRAVDDGVPSMSQVATVTVILTDVEEGPAIAVDDFITVDEDSGEILIDVLSNDVPDPDTGELSISEVGFAQHGVTSLDQGGATYAPNPNYCGNDQFNYQIAGGSSATVYVTVDCINDAPVAVGVIPQQEATEAEDFDLDISSYFSDVDDTDLTYAVAGLPSGISIDPSTGVLGGSATIGSSGASPYVVTITAEDPAGETALQQFAIDVLPAAAVSDDIFENGFE